MKRNAILFTSLLLVITMFIGCASTNVEDNPSEIEYKEISAKDYFNANQSDLYSSPIGYKISDVYVLGADTRNENGTTEAILKLGENKNAWGSDALSVYATDFVKNMNKTDSTWVERLDAVRNDEKYNGHYTVYLYGQTDGNAWIGYTTKVILYNIEGIPTQEQIEADKATAEKERIAKEEADKKAKAEKRAKSDAAGKKLAQGYTYHGIDEDDKNCKLFANGALESGHAYYISGFVVKYGGSMAKIEYGDGLFFSSQSNAVYVDYISQKVKGEVVEAGVTNLFGQTIEIPLTVVVAGGKGITKMPVVLGLIQDSD